MKKERIKKIMKRTVLALLVAVVGIVTAGGIYSEKVFNNISENVVRLHVIANSDSEYDQNMKLKVRDAVIKYSNDSFKDCKSSAELLLALETDMESIEQVAQECLDAEQSGYKARVSVGKCDFPAKSYGNYCFPAGEYQALRIEIGEADGKNWWCVLFPPLCYVSENAVSVSESAAETMKENLSEEAFETVNGTVDDSGAENDVSEKSGIDSNIKVSYKFKIVELFRRIKKCFD